MTWSGALIATTAYDIGAALQRARRAKGMSQLDLARMIGVTRQWVINVEKGAPTARLGLVLDALRCVGLLVDVIEDESDDLVAKIFGTGDGDR